MMWKKFSEEKPCVSYRSYFENTNFIVIGKDSTISPNCYWDGTNLESPNSIWEGAVWYVSHKDLIKSIPDYNEKKCLNLRCISNCQTYCTKELCEDLCRFEENIPLMNILNNLGIIIKFQKQFIDWLKNPRKIIGYPLENREETLKEWIGAYRCYLKELKKIKEGVQ